MLTKNILCGLLFSVGLFAVSMPLTAGAESDSELAITGNVLASPCVIAPDTIKGDVDLGSAFSNRLHNAGDSADWAVFSLNLTDCPVTTTNVVVHFTGIPDPDYPAFFKNTGTSNNVAIEVVDSASVRISNSSVRNLKVGSDHQAKIDLKGRMTSPQGGATSGAVSGLIELSFDFH